MTLGPQNVLSQAERHSKGIVQPGIGAREYGVPFLYSTNGEVIWHHDIRHELSRSRQISGFHRPEALKEQLQRNLETISNRLGALPNNNVRLRPYQREANEAIEHAITERKRAMLVAMATGTGKTFTMVNQAYRLMKTGAARRILFLVDRRALAAQAVRAFTSFEAEAGLKFDKIYDVFSQRFQREDFGEEEKRRVGHRALPGDHTYSTAGGPDRPVWRTYRCRLRELIGTNNVLYAGTAQEREISVR